MKTEPGVTRLTQRQVLALCRRICREHGTTLEKFKRTRVLYRRRPLWGVHVDMLLAMERYGRTEKR